MLRQLWGQQYLIPADITAAELLRYPDDGYTNEVYEGMLVKTMTTPGHGITCQLLGLELGLYARTVGFPNSRILQNALFDFTPPNTPKKTILAPDIAVLRQNAPSSFNTVTRDIPMIAVEVVSPNQTIDEIRVKATFYRGAGVDEVWILDPQARIAEIWTVAGQVQVTATQPLTSTLLPGFAVMLGNLFV
jgi:Uma2 family endonuclease